MSREQLIARKNEVRQQLAQAQRRLANERAKLEPPSKETSTESAASFLQWLWQWIQKGATGPRAQHAKIAHLETQVASLMAEEYRLRNAIDRERHQ